MICPRRWVVWRPGYFIPVFFLICSQAYGQLTLSDAETLALGQCFASRRGNASAGLNPAGLGWHEKSSCSFHHYRPFVSCGLDIFSLSVQYAVNRGGPGLLLSTMGIRGMRQTSSWMSYGLELHPKLYAGVGIHLGVSSVPEYDIHRMDAGFALGIQYQINDNLALGAMVRQPELWTGGRKVPCNQSLTIISGFSYSFYNTALFHADFQATAGKALRWCHGLSIVISKSIQLLLGIHNQPWSFSAGFSLDYKNWAISMAALYCMDRGMSPANTLSYVW